MKSLRAWPCTTVGMILAWVAAHYLMVRLWQWTKPEIIGDVYYYWASIQDMPVKGIGATMPEYPTPVVWLFQFLKDFWYGNGDSLLTTIPVFMAVLDLLFTLALWFSDLPHRRCATYLWIGFVLTVGPLLYFRFDMMPTVLVGFALLWLLRRPGAAGALLGLGAAVKLWPALLLVPMLAVHRDRRSRTLWFCLVGLGLAVASLVGGGWDRLVSPLDYQKDRGLQVEAITATPVMVVRTLTGEGYQVRYTSFKAFEVFGPGVDVWITISNVLTILGFLVIGWLCWRLFRSRVDHLAVAAAAQAIIAILIITNKTLSPQYVLWMAAPLVVYVALARGSDEPAERRDRGILVWMGLAIAALTQLIYPVFYDSIVLSPNGHMYSTLTLAGRNLLLLLWTVVAVAAAIRHTRPSASGSTTTQPSDLAATAS